MMAGMYATIMAKWVKLGKGFSINHRKGNKNKNTLSIQASMG